MANHIGPGPVFVYESLIVSRRLLIMSGVAPTSLAEERVRGSLDVLMTTPVIDLLDRLGQVEYAGNNRWKFWLVGATWCVVAAGFAAAMFWGVLKSFDHCLGRMPESSVAEWEPVMD